MHDGFELVGTLGTLIPPDVIIALSITYVLAEL